MKNSKPLRIFKINQKVYHKYCQHISQPSVFSNLPPKNSWSKQFFNLLNQQSDSQSSNNFKIQQQLSAQQPIFVQQCLNVEKLLQLSQQEDIDLQQIHDFWKTHQLMDTCIFDFCEKYKRQNQAIYKANRFVSLSRDQENNNKVVHTIKQSYKKSNFARALLEIYLNQFLLLPENEQNQRKIDKQIIVNFVKDIQQKIRNENSQIISYFKTDKDHTIYLKSLNKDMSIDEVLHRYYFLGFNRQSSKKQQSKRSNQGQQDIQSQQADIQ